MPAKSAAERSAAWLQTAAVRDSSEFHGCAAGHDSDEMVPRSPRQLGDKSRQPNRARAARTCSDQKPLRFTGIVGDRRS